MTAGWARYRIRRIRRQAKRPRTIAITAVVVVVVVGGVVWAQLSSGSTTRCQYTSVPAYFYSSSTWAQASRASHAPAYMILDVTGVGAGTAPNPHFQAVVRQAQAAGITVLGYSSTVNGDRPAAQVEGDVRNYKEWYNIKRIFLDVVSGTASELGYYQQLADYIHRYDPGPSVWLNPGRYPDQSYMSVGDVLNVFEGPYSNYLALRVPSWVSKYPASKFGQTIYATPRSELQHAITLSRQRRAGYIYITNLSGTNPYRGLPSYWAQETAAVMAGCPSGDPASPPNNRERLGRGDRAAADRGGVLHGHRGTDRAPRERGRLLGGWLVRGGRPQAAAACPPAAA